MPKSTRPPDSQSSELTDFAVYTGLRCGTRHTAEPSRTSFVHTARYVSVSKSPSIPLSGGRPSRPSSAYG